MISLSRTAAAWGTPSFETVVKQEISGLNPDQLPLQQALRHSSYLGDGDLGVVVLDAEGRDGSIFVKIGIMFTGVDAGSCCADDPTPLNEQAEYCQLALNIDTSTGEASVFLIEED